jgi:sugar fermentation stimulation protein A
MNPTTISINSNGLLWPKLIPGTLIKRYKRFMVDVRLKDGNTITAHCPNTGSMQECCEPGRPVYLSHHDRPNRKLKYTWELIEMPTSLVGVNTSVPNQLVFQSIKTVKIEELKGYSDIVKEIKTGQNSRIDLLLTRNNNEQCFVEIKNCTLVKDGLAFFPDAVTQRGRKHLIELQHLVTSGNRCVMFYLIQRMDADTFKPAQHIDPAYTQELKRAVKNGVELLAYDVCIDLEKISLNRKIPIHFDGDLKIE